MPISMRALAKIAGVSPTTVSYALRDDPRVSQATRDRIQQLARQLNCRRNKLAQSFFDGRLRCLGIIVWDIDSEFFPPIIKGIEEYAMDEGYSILVGNSLNSLDREKAILHMFLERRIGGLVIAPAHDQVDEEHFWEVRRDSVPMVTIDHRLEFVEADFVGCDDYSGATQVVEHLISLGHTTIGHIAGPSHIWTVRRRRAGYIDTLRRHGITPDPRLTVEVDFPGGCDYVTPVRSAVEPWLESGELPTAVFCDTDSAAVGLCVALRERGLAVPDDVSVAGFGDLRTGKYLSPGLTTVVQPKHRLGRIAAEILINRMQAQASEDGTDKGMRGYTIRLLDVQLEIRGSTRQIGTHRAF